MYDLKPKVQQVVTPMHSYHVPELIPDEFYKGYLSRVARINGRNNAAEIKQELSAWLKQSMPNAINVPAVFSLAKLLGMDVEDFIRQHTLAPVKGAIRRMSPQHTFAEVQAETTSLQSIMTLTGQSMKKEICLCEACTIEDIGYWGFSVWRRSHQITGIDWCTKHGTLLHEVSDHNAYELQPSHYLASGSFTENQTSKSSLTAVIKRYMQLIQDTLDLTSPLDARVTGQVLATQAKKYNLRTRVGGDQKTLSSFVLEQLPSDWLGKHFPYLRRAKNGEYLSGFDDVLRQNGPNKSCIDTLLGASVLFEDADEAMYQLTNQEYTGVKRNKLDLSAESIYKGYINTQGNIKQLAADLKVNYHALIERVELLGLPSMVRVDEVTLSAIKAFYDKGDLLEVINRPGVNHEKFSSVIRAAGSQFSSTIRKFT